MIINNNSTLAIYIHWPFCRSKCPYCDFNSHAITAFDEERILQGWLSELNYYASLLAAKDIYPCGKPSITSIFFGGGTPSLMRPATVATLIDYVARLWDISDDVEISLEANPTSSEVRRFTDFRAAGVNRISVGVQSLDDDRLRYLGREHSVDEAVEALRIASDIFPRYSFDMIYSTEGQTLGSWRRELDKALRYAGGHMSLYQLTIEGDTVFERLYKKGKISLPDDELSADMYEMTQNLMADAGYICYEISNYATSADNECRHNMAYWTGQQYLGIGAGAHGRLDMLLADDNFASACRHATVNIRHPNSWLESVESNGNGIESIIPLNRDERAQELIIMGLRTKYGVSGLSFKKAIGVNIVEYINMKNCLSLQNDGFILFDDYTLRVTDKGRLLLNTIIASLLD